MNVNIYIYVYIPYTIVAPLMPYCFPPREPHQSKAFLEGGPTVAAVGIEVWAAPPPLPIATHKGNSYINNVYIYVGCESILRS